MSGEQNGVRRYTSLMTAVAVTLTVLGATWAALVFAWSIAMRPTDERLARLGRMIDRETDSRVRSDSVLVSEIRQVNRNLTDLSVGLAAALRAPAGSAVRSGALNETGRDISRRNRLQRPINTLPLAPDSSTAEKEKPK